MSAERFTCETCPARDVDGIHVERCRVETKALEGAVAHGRGEVNIHGAKTHDLFAHIFTRTRDPLIAEDVTKCVIDLGWRPVVGSDPRRLWMPTTPPTDAAEAAGDEDR